MDAIQRMTVINQLIQAAQQRLPDHLADPIDRSINDGNVALCLMDDQAQVFGAIWGDDKIKGRNSFQTAWRKASQVWITGVATGKYEELIYTHQIPWFRDGIMKPDLIGWEGGLPVSLPGDLRLSAAISGMRSEADTALLLEALAAVGGASLA